MSSMRSASLAGIVAAMGIALVATGCGPGIGGTGTGATAGALVAFRATPSPVCSSAFADRLECAPPGTMNPTPAAGTASVRFVDATGNVVLELAGNDARLDAACQQLRFDGTFGSSAGSGAPAFFGVVASQASGAEVFASLSVQRAEPSGLTIDLRDVDGRVVVAPTTLERAPAVTAPPAPCP